MEIVVDKTGRHGFSHMAGDTIENLHSFARKIGVRKCWYHNRKGKNRPHYDIRPDDFNAAVKHGAKVVTGQQLIAFIKKHYGSKSIIVRNREKELKGFKMVEVSGRKGFTSSVLPYTGGNYPVWFMDELEDCPAEVKKSKVKFL